MKEPKFEWYVMNTYLGCPRDKRFNDFPYPGGNVGPYNIFNNIRVHEETIRLCKKFKTERMTFKDFTEKLRSIIQWQEWSRCEYEILVAGMFEPVENFKKTDCYTQALPNMPIIARYVLQTYYPRIRFSAKTGEPIRGSEKEDV